MNTSHGQPHVWAAQHVGAEIERVRALFAAAVDPAGGVHALIEVNSGTEDLSFDVLDAPELAGHLPSQDPGELRAGCRSAARLVSSFTISKEERLDEAGTGRLIRTVLHGDGGAVLCYSVVPGQYLVGFVFGPATALPDTLLCDIPLVDAADRAMTRLVNQLRHRMELPPQDAGGWADDSALSAPADTGGQTASDRAHVYPNDTGGPEFDPLLELVDNADLHFVSRVRARNVDMTVDHFGHSELRVPTGLGTPDARRKFYLDLAQELFHAAAQQGRLVRSTVGGTLRRLVLDVEQGAVYFYRLTAGDYLVGVTLYQRQVNASDRKMSLLATRLTTRAGS